ncbi:MAG: hypothetical protein WBZ33_05250, partial [Thermoactinomyces sp.]
MWVAVSDEARSSPFQWQCSHKFAGVALEFRESGRVTNPIASLQATPDDQTKSIFKFRKTIHPLRLNGYFLDDSIIFDTAHRRYYRK